jgi:D-arabinose 1-dehydrogenase-like Zn-dependent alcohol dehydrogenase
MKSYQFCECSAPLQLVETPTPAPGGTEVLLRVLAAGVCHTDLHVWDGYYDLGGGKKLQMKDRGVKLPLTLGHENVGEVVAVGPEARGVAVGDRRLVYPWIGCGRCTACARGDEHYCGAPQYLGIFRAGGYADHLLVPHPRCLFELGDLDPAVAAPLACSGLTAYGALKKLGPALQRDPVVVIGAGGLGLMCVALARAMGARGVVVVDLDEAKRDAARQAGAFATVDGRAPDVVQRIQDATGGPVQAAIDFVGSAATVQTVMAALAKGGRLVVVGLFGGELPLSVALLPLRAIALQGSYTGSPAEQGELLDLVRRAGPPRFPITTRPLRDANAALQALKDGTLVGRSVLIPAH